MKKTLALLCAAWPALASAAYVPNSVEAAVQVAVLRDEQAMFSNGNPSFLGESLGIQAVNAASLAQAAAGGRGGKPPELSKPLLVSGTLASSGGNATQGRWFDFADTSAPKLRARLTPGMTLDDAPKPGQALALVCARMEQAKNVLSLTRCEPAAAVAARETARLRAALDAFHQGRPTEVQVATLAINISMYADALPADHGCPEDAGRCRQSIAAVKLTGNDGLHAVLQRLRDAGVDLSAFDPRNRPLSGR